MLYCMSWQSVLHSLKCTSIMLESSIYMEFLSKNKHLLYSVYTLCDTCRRRPNKAEASGRPHSWTCGTQVSYPCNSSQQKAQYSGKCQGIMNWWQEDHLCWDSWLWPNISLTPKTILMKQVEDCGNGLFTHFCLIVCIVSHSKCFCSES